MANADGSLKKLFHDGKSGMQVAKSVAVLVCGDVFGKFKRFFRVVNKANATKGPFEAVFCIGNFFGEDNSEWESMKAGKVTIPVPCYVLGPCKEEHATYFPKNDGEDLAPNVIYLGRKGFLTTASGLKVAYLSGVEGRSPGPGVFTSKDITDMQCNFKEMFLKGVDFLFTSQWPKGVFRYLPVKTTFPDNGSDLISYLAITLKPCYHFSALEDVFYERLPYRNCQTHNSSSIHTTQFVGLGKICSAVGAQFIYGVTHIPLYQRQKNPQLQNQPDMSTECPYQIDMTQNDEPKSFSKSVSSSKNGNRFQKGKQTSQPQRKFQCWFCLGLQTDEHLIVNVGEHCYVALAKGWLVPDHFLIIPHSHFKDLAHLPIDAIGEVEDYKHLIRKHFSSRNKTVVFFERSYKCFHMQLQVVVLPESLRNSLEDIFLDTASVMNIPMDEIPLYSEMKQVLGTDKQYFYLEIEAKNGRVKKFVHVIQEEFPLEFGRSVLAKKGLLNLPERVDWKKCSHSVDEEKYVCKNAQNIFH